MSGVTRREFLGSGVAAAAALAGACRPRQGDAVSRREPEPEVPVDTTAWSRLQPLGFGGERDGLLFVPEGYREGSPLPLVLTLHGAGGRARGGLRPLLPLADAAGLILLAPDSRATTWDAIRGDFGPDLDFLVRAMEWTMERYAVDPMRVAVSGFSDGASYALSLALMNGDLFRRGVAFSPGFYRAPQREGKPPLFVSHGTDDRVLPIDRCSRRIVPMLRSEGYPVSYHEFEGGHVVPPSIAAGAARWLAGGG